MKRFIEKKKIINIKVKIKIKKNQNVESSKYTMSIFEILLIKIDRRKKKELSKKIVTLYFGMNCIISVCIYFEVIIGTNIIINNVP